MTTHARHASIAALKCCAVFFRMVALSDSSLLELNGGGTEEGSVFTGFALVGVKMAE